MEYQWDSMDQKHGQPKKSKEGENANLILTKSNKTGNKSAYLSSTSTEFKGGYTLIIRQLITDVSLGVWINHKGAEEIQFLGRQNSILAPNLGFRPDMLHYGIFTGIFMEWHTETCVTGAYMLSVCVTSNALLLHRGHSTCFHSLKVHMHVIVFKGTANHVKLPSCSQTEVYAIHLM